MVKRKASSSMSRSRSKRTRVAPSRRKKNSMMYRGLAPYLFTRYGTATFLTFSNSTLGFTYQSFQRSFTLNDCVGFSEFTTLFDQYKISKVQIEFGLQNNPDAVNLLNNATSQTNANFYPKIWYTPDYDDETSPTLEAIKQYPQVKCRVLEPNKIVRVVVRPKAQVQIYQSATSTGYGAFNGWLDVGAPGVPHYGLKACIDGQGINPNTAFRVAVEYKYWIQLKNPR